MPAYPRTEFRERKRPAEAVAIRPPLAGPKTSTAGRIARPSTSEPGLIEALFDLEYVL